MLSLVLSLKRDENRRKRFFAQAQANDFQIFDAIDADIEKEYILRHFNFRQAEKLYGRSITLGEAACTLSHLSIYKYLLQLSTESDEYFIVCEDDALFSCDYQYLTQIIKYQNGFDIILFGESKLTSFKRNWKQRLVNPLQLFPQKIGKYKLGKLYQNYTAGTVGYVISRRFIKNLLTVDQIFWLADDFQAMIDTVNSSQNSFLIGYLFPKLVIEDLSITSNLENERSIEQRKNKVIIKANIMDKLIKLSKTILAYFPKKYIAYRRK